jgi:hypothetical protein
VESLVGRNGADRPQRHQKRNRASGEDETEIDKESESAENAENTEIEFRGGNEMKVPDHIVTAVNALLAPYGETYVPGERSETAAGYKSVNDACRHLGVSKSSLYKLIWAGAIHPIKLTKGARNGKVVFAVADLEAYIASCRA